MREVGDERFSGGGEAEARAREVLGGPVVDAFREAADDGVRGFAVGEGLGPFGAFFVEDCVEGAEEEVEFGERVREGDGGGGGVG